MSVVISVVYGEKAYYSSVSQMNCFRIGEGADSNLAIPDLGYELTIKPSGRAYTVEIADNRDKRFIHAVLDEATAIDYEKRIALFISESDGKTSSVEIPSDCVIHVGRSDKGFTDGTRNEIVLDFPSDYTSLVTYSTQYAANEAGYGNNTGPYAWWERCKAGSAMIGYVCAQNGRTHSSGASVDSIIGVRPAIWLQL